MDKRRGDTARFSGLQLLNFVEQTNQHNSLGVRLNSKGGELLRALDSEISSQHTAELAVLHLLNRYDFDLGDLRCLLLGLFSFLHHSLAA